MLGDKYLSVLQMGHMSRMRSSRTASVMAVKMSVDDSGLISSLFSDVNGMPIDTEQEEIT